MKVNCASCDQQNWVDFVALKELQRVKCEGCDTSFNLFSVYKALYETIPLCKGIVDVSVDHAHGEYAVEAGNPTERGVIAETLDSNHFSKNSKQILQDIIILGNSFLQVISNGEIILKRLDPSELDFGLDWVQEPPFRPLQQKIIEIKRHDEAAEKIEIDDVLHFKAGTLSHEPFGQSIFGFWFTGWYFLRDCAKNATLRELKKHQDLQWFRDFRESKVLAATAVPHKLIFPWMKIDSRVVKIEQDRFQHYIERRRNEVSQRMERELFPRILKRKFEYENFPRLKWKNA